MAANIPLDKILFLDIETVPTMASVQQLSPALYDLWLEKIEQLKKRNPEKFLDYGSNIEKCFRKEAGIYAEFGKIVCISVGFIYYKQQEKYFRVKSFFGDDEKALLVSFAEMLNRTVLNDDFYLCGHNIKEFDVPYIARRMLINGIVLPQVLQIAGKKPWEVKFIDTLELWRFGDYKSYTSLKLLTNIFDIPTPKDDIDGSQVAEVYYETGDVERIAVYCQKDVLATAQLYLKFQNESCVNFQNITIV